MVERPPVKRMVAGSSPARGATIKLPLLLEKFLRATQSVAHCFEGISLTFLLRKNRFKNSKPKIFWRDDFLEGRSKTKDITLAPPFPCAC